MDFQTRGFHQKSNLLHSKAIMKKERKKKTEKYVCNQYLIGASIQKMQGISQLNNQKTNEPTEKQAKT